ncbi:MAG: 4-alpha-glucanotransferase [Candidatus Obscuribacterales bacterium]|nr:4-alpha-glucanotransferase [Candidatus Obscuribacterales bacterium]
MIDPRQKIAGVLIPVFAMRREGDLGIGDTACVVDGINFCARNGLTVLQMLPINETGGDNSPYNAISSVALDPVYLTVEPGVIPGLTKDEYEKITANKQALFRSASVDYHQVKELKLSLLKAAWKEFRDRFLGSTQGGEFLAFEKEHQDWLGSYTLFRILIDENSGNACWTQWASELQNYASALDYINKSEKKESYEDERRFYTFVQWLAFKQWTDLRKFAEAKHVRLMGDIPFGVSRYSADVWAQRELFDLDWCGGAPPERFFQADPFTCKWGQNWGIPLYKWDVHKKENYNWWRQRVERLTDVFHYFRIDHVLGFFRIYSFPWIPERNSEFLELSEEEASELCDGRLPQFLPRSDELEADALLNAQEGEEILKVILEAAGKNGVVAEDLGVVPDYVRPILTKLGIPGFAIPIFERNEEDKSFKKKDQLPPLSLATYGTHDHWPLVVFYEDMVARWHGADGHEAWRDVQRLMDFLGLDDENPPLTFTEPLYQAFVKTLMESSSWLVVFMIPDLLGTKERFNVPGSSSDSNWSCRLPLSLEGYEKNPDFARRIRYFAESCRQSRRMANLSPTGTIR